MMSILFSINKLRFIILRIASWFTKFIVIVTKISVDCSQKTNCKFMMLPSSMHTRISLFLIGTVPMILICSLLFCIQQQSNIWKHLEKSFNCYVLTKTEPFDIHMHTFNQYIEEPPIIIYQVIVENLNWLYRTLKWFLLISFTSWKTPFHWDPFYYLIHLREQNSSMNDIIEIFSSVHLCTLKWKINLIFFFSLVFPYCR